jgi:hypothetical protein
MCLRDRQADRDRDRDRDRVKYLLQSLGVAILAAHGRALLCQLDSSQCFELVSIQCAALVPVKPIEVFASASLRTKRTQQVGTPSGYIM